MTAADPHHGQPVVMQGPPLTESGCAVIMVHGRNAAPRNILDLVPRLDRADVTYLAPAAANNTWYPLSFLADIEQNEPYLASAIRRLDSVVEAVLAASVAPDRIVLLGFSQGACLAAEFAYRNPARYGGLVIFSGGLIGPPGTGWNHSSGSFDATPVFFGCSDVDAHVPKERVIESAAVFQGMGARVTLRLYPAMGHLVNDDEIEAAKSMLDRVRRTPGRG